MHISVILATYNRSPILKRTLESFCSLDTGKLDWELIVVDNADDRETKNTVGRFENDLPISYLVEVNPGKNNALNSGISQSNGELLVFTDDDILADPRWLLEMFDGASCWPSASVFGGRILGDFPDIQPPINSDFYFFKQAYTIADWELDEGPYRANMVWGPNMAVRTRIFKDGWSFDPRIGPTGKNYIMGSETEFTARLERAGFQPVYLPNSLVYHQIRPEQLTPSWLYGRAFRYGRSVAVSKDWTDHSTLLGMPCRQLMDLIKVSLKRPLLQLVDRQKALRAGIFYWKTKGIIHQCRQERLTN